MLLGRTREGHKLGQTTEALNGLEEAAELIERSAERAIEAEVHRVRGDLLSVIGNEEAAKAYYQRSLVVARRQSAKTLELRAAVSLANFWCDQGKRAEAHGLLAQIYGWFTEGFDTPILKEAKAPSEQLVE